MEKLDDIDVKYWEILFSGADIGHKGTMDYSARCPICGDSKKKTKLKRCHLFTKRDWDHCKVHCFNCGWRGNMYSFLETVSPYLYSSYKNEKRATSLNTLVKKHSELRSFAEQPEAMNILKNYEDDDITEEELLRQESHLTLPPLLFDMPPIFNDIEENDEYWNYLTNRGMSPSDIARFKKSKDSIVYNEKEVSLDGYIILPLMCYDKLYGFQIRSIEGKSFYSFIPEQNAGFKVWNWYSVDHSKPVYVFESYFDALSSGLDNVTAQLGASLNEDRLSETTDPIFVLDNQNVDETARKVLMQQTKLGFKVMIWPKGIKPKDFNEILKKGGKREKISSFIQSNIHEGIKAELMLKLQSNLS